jgi:hypothetical protein
MGKGLFVVMLITQPSSAPCSASSKQQDSSGSLEAQNTQMPLRPKDAGVYQN